MFHHQGPTKGVHVLSTAPLIALLWACGGDTNGAADASPVADSSPGPDGKVCASAPAKQTLDVPYASIAGVKKNLLALDIYVPPRKDGCKSVPVVVWVHGGGWSAGDKKNQLSDKVALFNGAGYLLVSINYRLSPAKPSSNPKRVMYPVHPRDVARAVSWVITNIAIHGGDAKRLAILGHSAGAHLVALVATDGSFLAAQGHKLDAIACVGSFDTAGYDIPANLKAAPNSTKETYQNAFGTDVKVWTRASPMTHVSAGKGIGDFLLASRGEIVRRTMVKAFADKLKTAGSSATIIDAGGLNHAQVNQSIGMAGDTVMTPPVKKFLKTCFTQ